MDRAQCKTITVYRPIIVKLNPAWPKYQMVCGEIFRIRSPLEQPERLTETGWQTLNFADAA
jgi:hypothetical protein